MNRLTAVSENFATRLVQTAAAIVIGSLICAQFAIAQTNVVENKVFPESTERPIHFEFDARVRGGTITSPGSFVLVIRNQTDRRYSIVDHPLIRPPDAYQRLRGADQSWSMACPTSEIGPFQALRCSLDVPSVSSAQFGKLFSLDAVFFLPGEYPAVASLTFKESVPDKETLVEQVETTLELEPPLSSLVTGGVIGSFLLVLFVGAQRLHIVLKDEGLQEITWPRVLTFALGLGAQAVYGGIVAVIVIVLVQRAVNLDLPIQIEIKDFVGGVIVGLFTVKVGEALQKQLSNTAQESISG